MADEKLIEQYELVTSFIPSLNYSSHKGQAGRIGIIGGCKEYTGAPYFAAISALKTGCDLSFVFCTRDAAPVIKSYSPELIVYPVLDQPTAVQDIIQVLPRLHSLIIGPGLGRDSSILTVLSSVITRAKELSLPLVFDADGLYHLNNNLDIISGYRKAILTPNMAEFQRLSCAVSKQNSNSMPDSNITDSVKNIAACLGNVTIVLKHENDIITDGIQTLKCLEPGSPRRCGGQGDLLSGAMGTFAFWCHQFMRTDSKVPYGAPMLAALGACLLTKKCGKLAFALSGRSTTTSDMISQINRAFTELFPESSK